MAKLIIGCIVIVFIIVCFALSKKKKIIQKKFSDILTIISILVTLVGLIIPGTSSYYAFSLGKTINISPFLNNYEIVQNNYYKNEISSNGNKYCLNLFCRKEGLTEWSCTENVKPGDTLEYMIQYHNIEDCEQHNVMLNCSMPDSMTLVDNSLRLKNANHPDGTDIIDVNSLTDNGINIGDYASNSNAYIIFKAKIEDDKSVPNTYCARLWIKGTVNESVLLNFLDVNVNK